MAQAPVKAASQQPRNWPASLTFLATPLYTYLTPAQRSALRQQPETTLSEIPPTLKFGPSVKVEIRKITAPSHPACGQCGLFAAANLPAGSFILPYLGEYHPGSGELSKEFEKSDYDLWLDREANVAIDADWAGNEARFINDYRGTGQPRPNAEFREVWDSRRSEMGIGIFVLPRGKRAAPGTGGIAKDDEILVNYGKGFWEKRRALTVKNQDASGGKESRE